MQRGSVQNLAYASAVRLFRAVPQLTDKWTYQGSRINEIIF